jgi:succinyl-diaminopimelate desuccinylase
VASPIGAKLQDDKGNIGAMSDPIVAGIQRKLRTYEDDLLRETLAVLRITSIQSDPADGAPFGTANREALDHVLALAGRWGMKTTDLEGYIGYAEFGSGKPLIVSLGHLDVVPVGPGWKHDPFAAEIDGDFIYGRGTSDDKGPAMAALFAARAIQECVPDLPARIRVVFGCNEESGFKCVERYAKTEEAPTYGIAPDAMWPLCHAEKGISNLTVQAPLPKGPFALLEVGGGQRPNIVMDACSARVRVATEARDHVEGKLAEAWDRNVTWAWEGDVLSLDSVGKAAHGAAPYNGDSASIRLFRFLLDLSPVESALFYEELFNAAHIGGAGLGIYGSDEVSQELTSNLGIVSTVADDLQLLFNVRYPVTWKFDDLKAKCETRLAKLRSGWRLVASSDSKPLYFPLDNPLVKTICEVVAEETGETGEPGVMGGGTYARALPNTVAVGTVWDGDGKAHETDERLRVEHLFKMSRIYAHILYRLAMLA